MRLMLVTICAACSLLGHAAVAETVQMAVESAAVGFDEYSAAPFVSIQLKPESVKEFEAFTSQRIGEKVSIRLGTTVLMTPIIREPIKKGTLSISGSFDSLSPAQLVDAVTTGGKLLEVDGSDK